MTEHAVTLPEVLHATGLSYQQLDHWCRRGWLDAPYHTRHHQPTPGGSGTRREWDPQEVAVAAVMARMSRAGLRPAVAASAARTLARDPLSAVHLGHGVWVAIDPGWSP